jgi:hypothetical protein
VLEIDTESAQHALNQPLHNVELCSTISRVVETGIDAGDHSSLSMSAVSGR